MKKTIAIILLAVLVAVGSAAPQPVAAAEAKLKVSGYSVAGVLDVTNVYAVTLNMSWPKGGGELSQVEIVPQDDAGFQQAERSGSRYIISNEALLLSSGSLDNLNKKQSATETFYFIAVDPEADKLVLEFNYTYGDDKTGDMEADILMIKSSPDPKPPPEIPYDPDPPAVDTSKYAPILAVAGDAALPFLEQETEELVIPITNTANYAANKISITLEAADKSRPFFTAERINATAQINTLSSGQTKDAKFQVKLAPGASSGIHEAQLRYVFRNNHGDAFQSTETVYIRVENYNLAPRLVALSTQGLSAGQRSQVKFSIKNQGLTAAQNIKVTLLGLDPAGVALINDVDVKYLETVEGKGSRDIQYDLMAAAGLSGSSTRLQLQLNYQDSNGQSYEETNSVFLPLYGVGETTAGVPRLIINRYDFSPAEIRAGGRFLLELGLLNTAKDKSIGNIKVTISADEGVFMPVGGSNTLFIEKIGPGQIESASLELATKADAENRPYTLNVAFEYEDNRGEGYSAQETISLEVRQNARLQIGDVAFYGEPVLYDMVPANLEFYNLGKTILHNLMVEVDGPFQFEGGSYFVGNFNPGASDSFNFALVPQEPGEQAGLVIFKFEDADGTPHEVEREFIVNVMEPFYPEDPGEMPPMPEPVSKWKYVGLGLAAVVLVAAAYIFWRRRRRKQKLNMQQAQEMTAATQAVVPEIEYVGFDDDNKPEQG